MLPPWGKAGAPTSRRVFRWCGRRHVHAKGVAREHLREEQAMDEQRRRRTAEARGRKTPQAVGGEHRHCGVWVGRGPPQRKKRVGGVKRRAVRATSSYRSSPLHAPASARGAPRPPALGSSVRAPRDTHAPRLARPAGGAPGRGGAGPGGRRAGGDRPIERADAAGLSPTHTAGKTSHRVCRVCTWLAFFVSCLHSLFTLHSNRTDSDP